MNQHTAGHTVCKAQSWSEITLKEEKKKKGRLEKCNFLRAAINGKYVLSCMGTSATNTSSTLSLQWNQIKSDKRVVCFELKSALKRLINGPAYRRPHCMQDTRLV